MNIPQPDRYQWAVIWLTTIPALFLWINAGLYATDRAERFAAGIVIVGALLVWRLSGRPD